MGTEILIPVGHIRPGDNYRTEFDEAYIESLWGEIGTPEGLLQPITVRTISEKPKRYELIAGECRWRAHVFGEAPHIRAFVRDGLSPREIDHLMMVENDTRRDLNPVDQGYCYQRQIDRHGDTIEAIAKAIGRRTGYVRDRINLLGLAPQIIAAVRVGALPYTTGLKLVGLDRNRQRVALREYLANPSMTAEVWQRRIDGLRKEQLIDANVTIDDVFQLATETYTPVIETTERKPGPVGLAKLLQRVLAEHDAGRPWSEGLEAEVRWAVDAIVGEKATARRAAAHRAWGTMRTEKAG